MCTLGELDLLNLAGLLLYKTHRGENIEDVSLMLDSSLSVCDTIMLINAG